MIMLFSLLTTMPMFGLSRRPFMMQFALLAHFSLSHLSRWLLMIHQVLYIICSISGLLCMLHFLPQTVQKVIVEQFLALSILQLAEFHMVQEPLGQLPTYRFRGLDHLIDIELQSIGTPFPYRVNPVLKCMFDFRPFKET